MSYTQEIKDKLNELTIEMGDKCNSIGYGYKEKNGKITKEKSFVFMFEKKKPLSELSDEEIIPSSIIVGDTEITTDVIEGTVSPTSYEACPSSFYLWSTDTELNPDGATTPTNQSKIRPLKGGVEINNQRTPFAGTLGFIAVDNQTNSLVGVTNAHVMCDIPFIASEPGRGVVELFNDNISQPFQSSNITTDRIGKTKRYVPLYSNANYSINQYVDGALVALDEDEIDLNECYKFEGLSFTTAPPFATTEEIDDLINNNWDFFSAGRTTGAKGEGETKLKFLGYYNVGVPYILSIPELPSPSNPFGTFIDRSVSIKDTIAYIASASTTTSGNVCFYPINSGDSGSALLAEINGQLKIIGLCFSGSSVNGQKVIGYACRIDKVAEILNISAFTGQTVNFTDLNDPRTYIVNSLSSESATTINGITYHHMGSFYPV